MMNVDSPARVIESEINDEYHGSDHCPLSLTLEIAGGAELPKDEKKNGGADVIVPAEGSMKIIPKLPVAATVETKKIIPKKRPAVDVD